MRSSFNSRAHLHATLLVMALSATVISVEMGETELNFALDPQDEPTDPAEKAKAEDAAERAKDAEPEEPDADTIKTNADATATPKNALETNKVSIDKCESFRVSAVSHGSAPYASGDSNTIPGQLRPQSVKGYLSIDCGISNGEADKDGPSWTKTLSGGDWSVLAENADYRMSVKLESTVYMKFEKHMQTLSRWDSLLQPTDTAENGPAPGMMIAQKDACIEKCGNLLQSVKTKITHMSQIVDAREDAAKLLGCPDSYQRAVARNTSLEQNPTGQDGDNSFDLNVT